MLAVTTVPATVVMVGVNAVPLPAAVVALGVTWGPGLVAVAVQDALDGIAATAVETVEPLARQLLLAVPAVRMT